MKEKIKLIKSDITKLKVDAIVNAANSFLVGGGGVDGAIHRAGGKIIADQCKIIIEKMQECPVGEACITVAGNMPSKFVIHTVGPVWEGGTHDEAELLRLAYLNSMLLASECNINTIAFPNISTGVYHFPKKEAAEIAINTVLEFFDSNKQFKELIFCCFDDENYNIYKEILNV